MYKPVMHYNEDTIENMSMDELGSMLVCMRFDNIFKHTEIYKIRYKLIDAIFTRKLNKIPRGPAYYSSSVIVINSK